MTFRPFDVVISSFPYVEIPGGVKRPVVILSPFSGFGERSGIAAVAMLTTAKSSTWPLDVPISDLASAGLKHACFVRMKLGSSAYERIDRKIGALGDADRAALAGAMRALFSGIFQ